MAISPSGQAVDQVSGSGQAAKDLLSGARGPFQDGMGSDLKQQLLDEEEKRAAQMRTARNPATQMGGAVNNMASMQLLGAGGSLGQ